MLVVALFTVVAALVVRRLLAAWSSGATLRVWSRKILHIYHHELFYAARIGVSGGGSEAERSATRQQVERGWSEDAIACLSVRTAFDLYLSCLQLPKGSEVLMSAVTIKDMPKIVRHHGLVPVPVDLCTDSMSPDPQQLQAALSSRTRLIVVAHIFGARVEMEPIIRFAKQHKLVVVEDCAEVYEGPNGYLGHASSDVTLFSFGTIKTTSALGGSIAAVRDPQVLAAMRKREQRYPIRSKWYFLKRVALYCVFRFISETSLRFGCFARGLDMLGVNLDKFITSNVRGFAGGNLFLKIRHRPSFPLLKLLTYKLEASRFDAAFIDRRTRLGRLAIEALGPEVEIPGAQAVNHNFWLFPIIAANPARLIAVLNRHGFDVTQGASQLACTAIPQQMVEADLERARTLNPWRAARLWLNLVYLPVYPEMPNSEVLRMCKVVKQHYVRLDRAGLHPVTASAKEGALPAPGSARRRLQQQCLQDVEFDIVIVGGGINGAAIARDAAMRGLRVCVVEKKDFASGASGNSAKLIHGGFRYVETWQWGLVSELCHERDHLRKMNPNLVSPVQFSLPQYLTHGNKYNKIDFGLWVYDFLSGFGTYKLHRRQGKEEVLSELPQLEQRGLIGGFSYWDCRADDARLTLANVRDAARNGAIMANYTEFVAPEFSGERVSGARLRDVLQEREFSVRARHLVYATGAYVDLLPERDIFPVISATKGTHLAVPKARLPLELAVGFQSPADRRWCFCVPFFDVVIVGTTDIAFDVKSGKEVAPTRKEVQYLLQATNHAFPSYKLSEQDVHCAWAGLRPLARSGIHGPSMLDRLRESRLNWAKSSKGSAHSRGDAIFNDARGITVLAGGKLTPFRAVAARVVDRVLSSGLAAMRAAKGERAAERCITDKIPVDSRLDHVSYAQGERMAASYDTHLWWNYGSSLLWIKNRVALHPEESRKLVAALPFTYAEVSHAVLAEYAETVEDVLVRRLAVYFRDIDQGLGVCQEVGQHMAKLLDRDEQWVTEQVGCYIKYVEKGRKWRKEAAEGSVMNAVLPEIE